MLGGFGFGRFRRVTTNRSLWRPTSARHNRFLGIPEHTGGGSRFRRTTLYTGPRARRDYELGLGIGIQYFYPLLRNLFFYAAVSSGPHFISVHTEQQAKGFVMDSEAGGGFYIPSARARR